MKKITVSALILFAVTLAGAQSGGPFSIVNSVAGTGGGTSTGGILSLAGTAGQPGPGGSLNGGTFNFRPGFWQPNFAPTSAAVPIGGRVLADNGAGLKNAVVRLTGTGGTSRWTITGSMGYYMFDEVDSGQTYVVEVQSKRFLYSPRILTVRDEITDVDFTPIGIVW